MPSRELEHINTEFFGHTAIVSQYGYEAGNSRCSYNITVVDMTLEQFTDIAKTLRSWDNQIL